MVLISDDPEHWVSKHTHHQSARDIKAEIEYSRIVQLAVREEHKSSGTQTWCRLSLCTITGRTTKKKGGNLDL